VIQHTEQLGARRQKYHNTHNFTTREGWYCQQKLKQALEQWQPMGRQKCSQCQYQGNFSTKNIPLGQ